MGAGVFTVSPALSQALQPDSLSVSLVEAVATGVKTNPEYGIVAASRRATDEELKQGKALYLPSVDMSANAGYEYTDSINTRSTSDDYNEDQLRSQANLTLTQMLFDGWNTKYEVQRQKARVTSSAYRVDETAEFVGLSIVEAYLDVLRQRYLLSISDDNVQDHLDILTQIEDGVSAGRSTNADLEQARARLASARATQANTLEALRTAESQYFREVGSKAGQLIVPLVPYDALRASVDEEVNVAMEHSPTLKILESDIEVAYAEAEGTKSTLYPEVDLQLSGSYANDVSGLETYQQDASALVVVNWNLYRGGADMARSREFRHRHLEAKERRAQAARALEDDVRRTWAGMIAAGSRAEQYHSQAEANIQVVEAYKDQFDLNRRTLLDVLDSQNELFVSQINKVNAEFVQMLAVYRLLALKGNLLDTMNIRKPPETQVATEIQWTDAEVKKAY